MKFPLVANAFGHTKVILEIRGNATGVTERRQRQFHRRHPVSDTVAALSQTVHSVGRLQS